MIPCVIIVRDRMTYARRCLLSLGSLAGSGVIDVHIVDHGSTWIPTIAWLEAAEDFGFPVHYRGDVGPHSLWDWDQLGRIVGNSPYLVTDCDIEVIAPADWLEVLQSEMDRCPDVVKVGLGLRIDDLPDSRYENLLVREWEAPFWADRDGASYRAPIDTTIALYRPLTQCPRFALAPARRLAAPYLARHLPWYEESSQVSEELTYYAMRALPGATHWTEAGRRGKW